MNIYRNKALAVEGFTVDGMANSAPRIGLRTARKLQNPTSSSSWIRSSWMKRAGLMKKIRTSPEYQKLLLIVSPTLI